MNEETILDIVAEIRAKAEGFERNSRLMVSESAIALFVIPIADRIEAAWRRSQGQDTKLLKVLDGIVRLTNIMDYDAGPGYVEEITDMIRNSAKEALGMNSAYRVALERIVKLLNGLDENCGVDPVEIRDIARAALGDDCKEVTPCSP